MVPRTSYSLEVLDICNTWMDNTRATNASEVRIPCVWLACVTCCRSSIPRTSHAVVHMMRASYARNSSSKCDAKRASHALHPAHLPREEPGVTFGPLCTCIFTKGHQWDDTLFWIILAILGSWYVALSIYEFLPQADLPRTACSVRLFLSVGLPPPLWCFEFRVPLTPMGKRECSIGVS
jgi:hypothetical protein